MNPENKLNTGRALRVLVQKSFGEDRQETGSLVFQQVVPIKGTCQKIGLTIRVFGSQFGSHSLSTHRNQRIFELEACKSFHLTSHSSLGGTSYLIQQFCCVLLATPLIFLSNVL